MKFLSNIRLLLIGLWLGAAVFFSFAIAPSAFAVLPSREVAGIMVSRSLMILNISGIVIAIVAVVGSFVGVGVTNKFLLWMERFLLLVTAVACAIGQFVIGLWLTFVKAQMGKPIDEVALDDPLRMSFNNLHEYSVWVLVGGMIAALIAFFIIAGRSVLPANVMAPSKESDFKKDFKI